MFRNNKYSEAARVVDTDEHDAKLIPFDHKVLFFTLMLG
jgi:hypothetical protein